MNNSKIERRKAQMSESAKRYRSRKKEELLYLKNHVASMENEITFLEQEKHHRSNTTTATTATTTTAMTTMTNTTSLVPGGQRTNGMTNGGATAAATAAAASSSALASISSTSSSLSPVSRRRKGSGDFLWKETCEMVAEKRHGIEDENRLLTHRKMEFEISFARLIEQMIDEEEEVVAERGCRMFPNHEMNNRGVGFYLTSVNRMSRYNEIMQISQFDLYEAQGRIVKSGLITENLTAFPYCKTNMRKVNSVSILEVTRASFFFASSALHVAKSLSKIFWAEVNLPFPTAGSDGLEYEELDTINDSTSYARFVCRMGTPDCRLPCMERLLIRRREIYNTDVPTIVWRTAIEDVLYPPKGLSRIDECGCVTVEDGQFNGQNGAILKMVVHIRPPLNTLELPPGTAIESYMAGLLEYIDQVEAILGVILLL